MSRQIGCRTSFLAHWLRCRGIIWDGEKGRPPGNDATGLQTLYRGEACSIEYVESVQLAIAGLRLERETAALIDDLRWTEGFLWWK